MLLRICLILTILAGLGTVYVALFPVKDIITTTRQDRDSWNNKYKGEVTLYQKTDKELKKTQNELAATNAILKDTQGQLEAANSKNAELDKQVASLTDKLTKTTARAETDEQDLEKWRLLNLTPEQIKGALDDLAKTKKALAGVEGENKVLVAKSKELERELFALIGPTDDVPLPIGLKGKVLAVDPKYDFVVLDIGDDQGVKEHGVMMINRRGKLIGKVRITSVEKTRSIASIMPAWKHGDVMEGDQVIY
jgi:hypothetical protein